MICILSRLAGTFPDNGPKVPFTTLSRAEYLVE